MERLAAAVGGLVGLAVCLACSFTPTPAPTLVIDMSAKELEATLLDKEQVPLPVQTACKSFDDAILVSRHAIGEEDLAWNAKEANFIRISYAGYLVKGEDTPVLEKVLGKLAAGHK